MYVQGGCLCSAIRFQITGAPLSSCICHCATCRRASAAPAVAWISINRAQFTFVSGVAHCYRSSQGVVRQFCRSCGSQLTYEIATSPNTIDVTTVSLDDPIAYPPTMEVWLDHRLPWQTLNRTLIQFSRWTDVEGLS